MKLIFWLFLISLGASSCMEKEFSITEYEKKTVTIQDTVLQIDTLEVVDYETDTITMYHYLSTQDSLHVDDVFVSNLEYQDLTSRNASTGESLSCFSWTAFSFTPDPYNISSLIRFNGLTFLDKDIIVDSAFIHLYSIEIAGGAGKPQGDNRFNVYRIMQDWEENQVTFLTLPSFNTTDYITSEQNQLINNNMKIEVTSLVSTMVSTENNFGFYLRIWEETPYKSINFASSEYPVLINRPQIEVYYH